MGKTDTDRIDILVILDRSGSMEKRRTDHEGGLRSFVADQKALAGDVRFTFVQFDTTNPCEIVYDRTPIDQVGEITLVPRGGTPLLDALGKALAHMEQSQARLSSDQTIVMVITDGEENSSREWTTDTIKARITSLEARGWQFLYLGANVDAFTQAATVGIHLAQAAQYQATPQSVQSSYTIVSNTIGATRAARSMGITEADALRSISSFTPEERTALQTSQNVAYDGGAKKLADYLNKTKTQTTDVTNVVDQTTTTDTTKVVS